MTENIIHVDFGYDGKSKNEKHEERLKEIHLMAEKVVAIQRFLESDEVEIDEHVLEGVVRLYPVFKGDMETDLLSSTETDWRTRPEYFKRIADIIIFPDPEELREFVEHKIALMESGDAGVNKAE